MVKEKVYIVLCERCQRPVLCIPDEDIKIEDVAEAEKLLKEWKEKELSFHAAKDLVCKNCHMLKDNCECEN